jgi:hypothetical protein
MRCSDDELHSVSRCGALRSAFPDFNKGNESKGPKVFCSRSFLSGLFTSSLHKQWDRGALRPHAIAQNGVCSVNKHSYWAARWSKPVMNELGGGMRCVSIIRADGVVPVPVADACQQDRKNGPKTRRPHQNPRSGLIIGLKTPGVWAEPHAPRARSARSFS